MERENGGHFERGLLLGGGICHITATQVKVKKFLLAYVILF